MSVQVPNAMPRPQLTLCPHTHMDALKAAELLDHYMKETSQEKLDEVNSDPVNGSKTLNNSVGVMKSLVQMYRELNRVDGSTTKYELSKLANWKQVKDELMSENIFNTLAQNRWLPMPFFDGRWHLDPSFKDLVTLFTLLCERGSLTCGEFRNSVVGGFLQANSYQKCITLDMFLDGPMEQATSEGIKNGLSLIILAENTLLSGAFNLSWDYPIPGFQNILSPSTAMKGIRLIVNEPGIFLDPPDLYGIDIPPAVSATIGLTAKRIHHLRYPYTSCSVVDPEARMLKEAVRGKIGNNTGEMKIIRGTYSLSRCR